MKPTTVFDLIGERTGNIAITGFDVEKWGGEMVVNCLYRYPPDEKPFKLRFKQVRSIQWITVRMDADEETAQVLTHDIGEGNYQRTARFATILAEVVISYGTVEIEKTWE